MRSGCLRPQLLSEIQRRHPQPRQGGLGSLSRKSELLSLPSHQPFLPDERRGKREPLPPTPPRADYGPQHCSHPPPPQSRDWVGLLGPGASTPGSCARRQQAAPTADPHLTQAPAGAGLCPPQITHPSPAGSPELFPPREAAGSWPLRLMSLAPEYKVLGHQTAGGVGSGQGRNRGKGVQQQSNFRPPPTPGPRRPGGEAGSRRQQVVPGRTAGKGRGQETSCCP